MSKEVSKSGITLGTVIAAIVSWSANHSIFWMIVHAFFGWFYIIYYLLFVQKYNI